VNRNQTQRLKIK